MSRAAYIACVCLGMMMLSLVLTACGGRVVTMTPVMLPSLEGPAAKIDQLLNSLTSDGSFTGAVLVAQNGEVLLSRGYGLADRDRNFPNTPQTKYRIGSITKQFTAMAILILQDQGELKVQDRVCLYVPECPVTWQEITIHHLLIHTSGIPDWTDFPEYTTIRATPTVPLQTIGLFKDKPLVFSTGETWSYSNSGYDVLGYIIEQASGQSYETFLRQNIFEPLQMTNTGYEHDQGGLAKGYTGRHREWVQADYIDMSGPYAASGLYSTVEDLYLWDQALYTERLVSQELLNLMFTPHVRMPDSQYDYGYGWALGDRDGHFTAGHAGWIEGFTTKIRRYLEREDRATIIVLSNRDTTDVETIVDQIAQVLFPE
jgi:CubicO group peptidase (beta-lactamase class C family)